MVICTDSGRDFVLGFEDYAARKSLYIQGSDLSGEILDITEYLENKTSARDKALKTLSYSSKTSKALIRTLIQAGFCSEIATQTVLQLKKDGYIDEKGYCSRCLEVYISKGYGPLRIQSELIKKGFTSRMVEYTMGNDHTDYQEKLYGLMGKNIGKFKDYGAVYRYFFSRGYPCGMISEVYEKIKNT